MFKNNVQSEIIEFFFCWVLLLSFLSFLSPTVPILDHKTICESQPSLFLSLHAKLFIQEKEVGDS